MRVAISVTGVVQGVGFRPFVHRLARGLGGFVGNDGHGGFIEVEGARARLAPFLGALKPQTPPLAVIDEVRTREIPARGESGFRIVESPRDGAADTLISA